MTDTRPKAMEKARQRATAQAKARNTGFTAEREKAKQALRDEIGSQAGQNVHKFAARIGVEDDNRILRVAAYCRVSTDDIDQVISIELQKNTYRDMIKGNPKWKYAGTYVDEGISATSTAKRDGFKKMIADALAGRIEIKCA